MSDQGEPVEDNPKSNKNSRLSKAICFFRNYVPPADASVAIATFFLVIVGIWGVIETRKALELTQRAWISPLGAQLIDQVIKSKPIRFVVTLQNSGRAPATDLDVYYNNATIDSFDPQFADMDDIKVPDNTSCDSAHIAPGHTIVPPSESAGIMMTMDSSRGNPPFVADDRIMSHEKFYVVTGCAVYKTYEKEHHTGFCYVLSWLPVSINAVINNQIVANPAPAGAPPVSADGPHAFGFQTCSTGFNTD